MWTARPLRFLASLCLIIAVTSTTLAQDARVFMALDGEQFDQPSSGPTGLTMNPGQTVTVMVWMEDLTVDHTLLMAYQLLMSWSPEPLPGSTGTIDYQDNMPGVGGGDSVTLDLNRPDWIFADTPLLPPTFNETPAAAFFGVFYSMIYQTGINPDDLGIRYLTQFRYTASLDACGLFEARLRLAPKSPPRCALFTPQGSSFADTEYQKLLIEVTHCDEPCAGPCDDENACTDDDQWCDGECAGQPTVCPIEDCLAMSCAPGGSPGNCANSTAINEGLWCHGPGTTGTCSAGTCIVTDDTLVRLFMAPEPLQDLTPQQGPTYYSMLPGETVTLMAWLEDLAPGDSVSEFKLFCPTMATPHEDATGSVSYVDGPGLGNSVLINTTHRDWIFDQVPVTEPDYVEDHKRGAFGAAAAIQGETAIDPGVAARPRYLAEFDFEVSPDASGTFELPFRGGTVVIDANGRAYDVDEYQPLILFVGAPQPLVSVPPNGGTDPVGPGAQGKSAGRDHIIVQLNGPAAGLRIDDFNIASTAAMTPAIIEIVPEGNSALLQLDQALPPGHCTLIVHVPSGWYTKLRSLPGDINGDGTSNPGDMIALIDHLNGVLDTPLADWQCDIDQSGTCNGLDILAHIDLLNGADGGTAWNGVEVPECP